MIDLNQLVPDEHGYVRLVDLAAPTDTDHDTDTEAPETPSPLDSIMEITDERERGLAARLYAQENGLHFLGFCVRTGAPLFSEQK